MCLGCGGYYQFDNLEDNTAYSLRFVAPDGFTLVNQDAGGDDTVDSDVDATTGFVSFVLSTTAAVADGDPDSSATVDARWDAGMVGTLSIGNLVWFDLDGDGAVDDGEPVLDGVNVRLLDADNGNAEVATTTTDSNGRYLFDGLTPGNYIVEVQTPTGLTTTSDTANSTNPDNGNDNDDNGTDDTTTAGFVLSDVIALGYGTGANGEADRGVEINGVADTTLNRNADYTLDFGFVKRDFGDLIDAGDGTGNEDYNTNDANAASHTVWDTNNDNVPDVSGAIWLGSQVDGETDGQPSANPNGVNGDGADEDGVIFRSGGWPVNTVITDAITINLSGVGSSNADVGVWIDWDDDGTFDDFYELSDVSAGTHTINVNAPATYGGDSANSIYFRVRAFESGTALAAGTGFNGASSNGEVEDYRVQFGPTAVTLATVSVEAPTIDWALVWFTLIATSLMAVTVAVLWFRRPQVNKLV